jgi:heat shock protein HslJ
MKRVILYVLIFAVVATLGIVGLRIIRNNNQPAASAGPTANPIQNITWKWVSVTEQSTGAVTTVPVSKNYTLTFNPDGTLKGKADCNTFTGSYSQANGLIITLGASTQMYCGDTSLDQKYLALLSSVVAGGPDGAGGLALESAGGAQRMSFKK